MMITSLLEFPLPPVTGPVPNIYPEESSLHIDIIPQKCGWSQTTSLFHKPLLSYYNLYKERLLHKHGVPIQLFQTDLVLLSLSNTKMGVFISLGA